jgi:hypothetical protein
MRPTYTAKEFLGNQGTDREVMWIKISNKISWKDVIGTTRGFYAEFLSRWMTECSGNTQLQCVGGEVQDWCNSTDKPSSHLGCHILQASHAVWLSNFFPNSVWDFHVINRDKTLRKLSRFQWGGISSSSEIAFWLVLALSWFGCACMNVTGKDDSENRGGTN